MSVPEYTQPIPGLIPVAGWLKLARLRCVRVEHTLPLLPGHNHMSGTKAVP
jgi:hypothetical protein